MEIVNRDVVPQSEEYRFDPASGAVRLMPIAPERGESVCIDDTEALALANLAKRIEGRRGTAQDIEWAIGADGDVRILQGRPETVWSQRESAGLVSESRTAVGHVLARLSGGRVAGAGPGHRNP